MKKVSTTTRDAKFLLVLVGLAMLMLQNTILDSHLRMLSGYAMTSVNSATAPCPVVHGNHGPINSRLPPLLRMPESMEVAMMLILQARTARNQRASFLQIGANDGKMFDPLYPSFNTTEKKANWLGLQAEPQPNLYGDLAILHADAPDWAFYLGAVAPPDVCVGGTIHFCETKTPGVGDWPTQGQINHITNNCGALGSTMHLRERPCVSNFDDLIYRHATPAYLSHVMKYSSSSQPHRTYNIDLLQIDVEGKDYDILKLIDWNQLYPVCIQYESQHLGPNGQLAKDLLQQRGYKMVESLMDVLACQVAQPTMSA